ncbi:MAG: tetratricopeptide repeat protein [Acidobacteriota bacterium]
MTEDPSWQRLDELFHRAWDLPAEQRAAFLDRTCGDDPALHRELTTLLSAATTPSGWIDGSASDEALDLLSADARFPRGTLIGRYRTLRLLGRGGMGSVYLAERSDGHYDQKVALKVIKRGMDTDALLERFRRERQILAQLDHPSIARLVDGGATRDGRPYLVMEHIEGEPIDAYARRQGLTLDQRLALFLQICHAVRYSHRNLVIHRDLKPSNILVTAQGAPKLLDFGTAKILAEVEAGQTSQEIQLVTPGYASPEQIEGGPITTACDVFGLGVLLYELLADVHPFEDPALSRQEVTRAVLGAEPLRPSLVAPGERRSRLRGDLDAIVLYALRKEPTDRYPSVSALIRDIERHRLSQPVHARQGTLRYRAHRFLQRHRWGLGAALLVFALTAALIAALFLGERKARREQVRAEAMTDYLKGMFQGFDPFRGEEQPVTAREMLDRGVERLESELSAEPATALEVLLVLAEIYGSLGHYDDSQSALRRGLEIQQQELAGDFGLRSRLLVELAEMQTLAGNLAAAGTNLGESLELLESHRLGRSPQATHGRLQLGIVERLRGRYSASAELLEGALDELRQASPQDAERLDEALIELGRTRLLQGDYRTARSRIEEAVERRRQRYGSDHPKTIVATEALGTLEFDSNNLEAAQEIMHRVLEAHVEFHGPDHPVVIRSLYNLGALEATLGRYESAAERFRATIERMRSPNGFDHPNLPSALMWSARVALDRGEIESARRQATEALERITRSFPADHGIIRDCLNLIGNIERGAGDLPAARETLRRSLALSPESSTAHFSRLYLAEASLEAGDLAAAQTWVDQFQEESRGDPKFLLRQRLARATLALRRQQSDDAQRLLAAIDTASLPTLGVTERLELEALVTAIDLEKGRFDGATTRARRMLAQALESVGRRSRTAGKAHLLLALAHLGKGRREGARFHLEAAIAILPAPLDQPPQGGPSARQLLAQIPP